MRELRGAVRGCQGHAVEKIQAVLTKVRGDLGSAKRELRTCTIPRTLPCWVAEHAAEGGKQLATESESV
jgi:hypothetical protein